MTFKAMALDLSLTGTGLAWWTGGPRVGLRTVRSKHDGHQRLQDICTAVATASAHVGWPDLAVIEGYSYGSYRTRKGPSLKDLTDRAELQGLVTQQLWTIGVPYVLVTPGTLKVYATGHGRAGKCSRTTCGTTGCPWAEADKAAVQEAVQQRYGVLCAGSDEADALTMLAMALHHYQVSTLPTVPDSHSRALEAVHWPTLDPASGGVTDAAAPPSSGGPGNATAHTGRDATTPPPPPDAATTDRSSTLLSEAGAP